ncbi:hypothetical protein M5D96_008072, partial [Drosophila gunungcola]
KTINRKNGEKNFLINEVVRVEAAEILVYIYILRNINLNNKLEPDIQMSELRASDMQPKKNHIYIGRKMGVDSRLYLVTPIGLLT